MAAIPVRKSPGCCGGLIYNAQKSDDVIVDYWIWTDGKVSAVFVLRVGTSFAIL